MGDMGDIWCFPKIGVPPNHQFQMDFLFFPQQNHVGGSRIYGNNHLILMEIHDSYGHMLCGSSGTMIDRIALHWCVSLSTSPGIALVP